MRSEWIQTYKNEWQLPLCENPNISLWIIKELDQFKGSIILSRSVGCHYVLRTVDTQRSLTASKTHLLDEAIQLFSSFGSTCWSERMRIKPTTRRNGPGP